MTSAILLTTQAIGEFLIGGSFDFLDATADSISAIPGQVYDSTKYALGVDRYVGEGRSWCKMGMGYRGDFWESDDNGLSRFAERFNNAVFSFGLAAVNTVGMGYPYKIVNQEMGIDCPYFFPGPTNAREMGRFFSSGLAVMLTGRQLLMVSKARIAVPMEVPTNFQIDPIPVVAQGSRLKYAIPSVAEDLVGHIRRGNVVAPSLLRQMLNTRVPTVLDPLTQTTVQLFGEGHLPIKLFETLLWETHPRTIYLVDHLSVMRARYPRLAAIWNHYNLGDYIVEALPNGDSQLVPNYCPVAPKHTPAPVAPVYN